MQSFDNFRKTLSVEKLSSEVLNQIQSTNIKQFSEHDMKLAVTISNAVATSTLELLKQYHEWLQKQP